jgi:hypothetical protein
MINSKKNSNDTTGDRNRDLPACSAVTQPTAPQRAALGASMKSERHHMLRLNLRREYNTETDLKEKVCCSD